MESVAINFVGRTPKPRSAFVGMHGEHNVEQVVFTGIPQFENGIVTMNVVLPDGTAGDTLNVDDNTVVLTRTYTQMSGQWTAWIVVQVGTEMVWKSDVFRLIVMPLPEIEEIIDQQYPTALEEAMAKADEAIASAGAAAQSAEDAASAVEAARDVVAGLTATAVTLTPGSDATAEYQNGVLIFGIPRGEKGEDAQPEQIQQDVEDWLDDHPEATTTVQDGSITKAKLNASLQGTVDDVDDLKSALSDFENTISVTETIKSSNLLNISNATTGYYWSNGHVDSTSYNNTGYIAVEEGKTLTFQYGTKDVTTQRIISEMRFIAAYDENKNFVSSASKTAQSSYTVPTGIKYVILGIASGFLNLNNTKWSAVVYSTEVIAYEDYFEPYTTTEIKESVLPKTVRRQVNILSTDSESDIIEKLVNAYNTGDTDVLFERAHYSFGTELENVWSTYNLSANEIPIGNNCRYFFNGATLEAYIDLSQHPTAEGEEEFYCNFFGCQRSPSSYEMYDGVLIATDTRYIVHDESSAKIGTYKHIYKNVEMHYHTNLRQEAIRKCIGGGTGASGVVEIVGCKFTTDGTDSCVSFHGNSSDVVGAEFDLNIRDSWFSNSVRAGVLSANQTARLFYTGNSANANPTTYDRWTVTAFLNEVRS